LLDHPRTVYLREADLLSHLDGWLTVLFDPANLDATLDVLIAASQDASGTAEAVRKVERTLADCHRKLARHRAALDAGLTWRPSRSGLTTRPRNERAPRPSARSFALPRP
jgi:hypothetical protein